MQRSRIAVAVTAGVLSVGGLTALPDGAGAAPASATAAVRDDFDGDGVGDVVTGRADLRALRVEYSSATFENSSHIARVRPPGDSRAQDPFSLTAADYNGDGIDDLAVGDRRYHNRGAVFVYLGSAAGLADQPSTTLLGPAAQDGAHWEFGGVRSALRSLAAADVDGDGRADLAVDQVKYDDSSGQPVPAGSTLHVYRGSAAGLSADDPLSVSFGMPAPVAFADFDGDGWLDLLAARNGPDSEGILDVFPGTADGFAANPKTISAADIAGIDGLLGRAVGDVNGDGYADALAGASGHETPGAVVVFFGGPHGLSAARSQVVREGQVTSNSRTNDRFGSAIAVGHIRNGVYPDVVVGAPLANVDGVVNAGAVVVLTGSADGLSTDSAQYFTLRTPWVLGQPRRGAHLGSAFSVADFGRIANPGPDGHDDVLISAPGDNWRARRGGFVIGLQGAASGLTADHFTVLAGVHDYEQLGTVLA